MPFKETVTVRVSCDIRDPNHFILNRYSSGPTVYAAWSRLIDEGWSLINNSVRCPYCNKAGLGKPVEPEEDKMEKFRERYRQTRPEDGFVEDGEVPVSRYGE